LDFYDDYGSAVAAYDDWFWAVFSETGPRSDQFGVWLSDRNVYEK
jgi:hypothetical protein